MSSQKLFLLDVEMLVPEQIRKKEDEGVKLICMSHVLSKGLCSHFHVNTNKNETRQKLIEL
jgi:hypothetical protein